MSKKNIKSNAETILASNPNLPEVFMTSDGQGFTTEAKAEQHQRTLGANKKVKNFKRAEKVEKVEPATEPANTSTETGKTETETGEASILDLSIPELKPELAKITEVAELTDLSLAEEAKGDEARKGALSAIADRIKEIQEANQDQ